MLAPQDCYSSIRSALMVAAVVHEVEPLSSHWRFHPTVKLWSEDLVFVLNYAMKLNDYMRKNPIEVGAIDVTKIVGDNEQALSNALDLATTDYFKMETPWFWGQRNFHKSHLNFMACLQPHLYKTLWERGVVEPSLTLWPAMG